MTDYRNPQGDVGNETYGNSTTKSGKETEIGEYSNHYTQDGYKVDSIMPSVPSPAQESPNYYGQLTPKEVRISFNKRSNASSCSHGEENAAFKRNKTLMRTKTNSRLIDQPQIEQRSSQKTPKSGKGHADIEEDDELSLDDDLPDEYKKLRYNKWTLFQLTSLIVIISALVCTLATPDFRNKNLYDLQWWKWEVMILVFICGRLVSGWGIRILVFIIERSFVLRKKVLYFVYGLRKAVQNCIWLTLVLIAWECIFNKKIERLSYGKKVLPYVTKIWICLLVGTVFWLLKTLLIEVLASSFHVSKFLDRIQDSLFSQHVIETLSGPPMIEMQQEHEDEDWVLEEVEKLQSAGGSLPTHFKANTFKGFRKIGSLRSSTSMARKNYNGITIDLLHRLNQKNISAWSMNRMMNAINTSMLTTSDEHLLDVNRDEDETSMQITNENQAKLAAKNIFWNMAEPGSKCIYLEDLNRFLRDDEALKTIRLFDEASASKGISKRALKNWVVRILLGNILVMAREEFGNSHGISRLGSLYQSQKDSPSSGSLNRKTLSVYLLHKFPMILKYFFGWRIGPTNPNSQPESNLEINKVDRSEIQNLTRLFLCWVHVMSSIVGPNITSAFRGLDLLEKFLSLSIMSLSVLFGKKNLVIISNIFCLLYFLGILFVNVFRERRALALSIKDTKRAVDKLHQMFNVVVGIIIIIIWLLILKVATTQFFIFLSSQLVLVAFVFGNTCKTMFEAVIFLFIMHPFDVGDRCEIDGVQMIVEEMNILTTIFLRYDNQKIAYPNNILCTMPIANYHRSPDMGDAIDFCIHVSTPTEKIAKMKETITIYIEAKSEHWLPEPMIVLRDVEDLNRLKISIWLSHRMNFQDMGERWIRRALLVEEIIKIFKDLDIEYRMPPLDINVRSIPGLASNQFPSNWTTCAN